MRVSRPSPLKWGDTLPAGWLGLEGMKCPSEPPQALRLLSLPLWRHPRSLTRREDFILATLWLNSRCGAQRRDHQPSLASQDLGLVSPIL